MESKGLGILLLLLFRFLRSKIFQVYFKQLPFTWKDWKKSCPVHVKGPKSFFPSLEGLGAIEGH